MSPRRAPSVTLLAPGLLGPPTLARGDVGGLGSLLDDLNVPSLTLLLSRARTAQLPLAGGQMMPLLLAALECPAAPSGEWPLAAWSRLGAGEHVGEQAWIRADPVHLRADMSKLRLFHGETLDLSLQEAAGLIEHVNAEMADHVPAPLQLLSASHWSMGLDHVPQLCTRSPEAIHGDDVSAHLPTGADALEWRRMGNEMQMVLHDAPVNRERGARGKAPVNSLWFWGVGVMPEVPRPTPLPGGHAVAHTHVWCRQAWGAGAARWRGAQTHAGEPATAAALLAIDAAHHLVCLDNLSVDDPHAWRDVLEAVEAKWLAPLLAALGRGRLESLTVHAGHGIGISLTRALARQFWRRRRPLAALVMRRWHESAASP